MWRSISLWPRAAPHWQNAFFARDTVFLRIKQHTKSLCHRARDDGRLYAGDYARHSGKRCITTVVIMSDMLINTNCYKSNPNFHDITWNEVENIILHEIFRVVSRFPHYISCYIAESRLPLGQWTLLGKQAKFPWYNMKCRTVEENEILHELFRVISRNPCYIFMIYDDSNINCF